MSTKYIKCAIMMKFLYKENKVFQYFIVVDQKYKKYVLQNRYALNYKFEEIVERNALSLVDNRYTFINRRDEEDRVTLEFSYSGNVERKPSGFFAVVGDIPYSDGCEECRYNEGENVCAKKGKKFEKALKTCKMFSQIVEAK